VKTEAVVSITLIIQQETHTSATDATLQEQQ